MLDKIKDLHLNLNGSKAEYFLGQYKKNGNLKKHQYTDTLNCSEAIQYVMQKKWQIKELNFLSGSRISISFLISGIEFNTIIDTSDLVPLSIIDFTVGSESETDGIKKKISAFISIDVSPGDLNEKNNESELPGIKMLMQRLSSLNVENELSSHESSALNNIFDDITDFIIFDMSSIILSLLEFITRLTGTKVNISGKNSYSSIFLNKIVSIKI